MGLKTGLKIGVVSKLSGFSPSGIRYFEEHGIVSPSHGRDGAYRSFDLPDVARLLECRNYRECGCETAQIASLLSHSSTEKVDAALRGCEEQLRARIEEAQRLEAFLARRRQMIDRLARFQPGRVEIARCPATYWAPLWIPGEHDEVEARIPSEEDGFPIPYADSSLLFETGLPCDKDAGEPFVGYAVARHYVERTPSLATSVFLRPCTCAHGIVRVKRDFTPFAEDLEALSLALRERGLTSTGTAFTQRICTLYDLPDETRYDEIWVPVE